MSQPLVSVVIATYNMGQYLQDAVQSVLDQTWKNLEVVVIDDGSTDDTPERMAELTAADSRVVYVRTPNQGQPKAKNAGINKAKGNFIAFCDGDDQWRKNKLELQMPQFNDPEVGVVYSDVSYFDGDGVELDKEQDCGRVSGFVTNQLLIKNFVPFGTAVIRRACIEQDGMFDEALPMGIDWDLWLRYSVRWKFAHVAAPTYRYRVWSGQMSKNYRGRYENAFRILRKFLDEHPGQVSPHLEARAWSDMYVGRGMHVAQAERKIAEPLRDIVKGIRYDLTYVPAWKSLIKLVIRRV